MNLNFGRIICVVAICLRTSWAMAAEDPPAVEKWSDARLPVTRGLAVWLDASTLIAAQKAAGRAPSQKDDPIEFWPDGSGRHRDLMQKIAKSQPIYRPSGEFHAVHFNGQGMHLRGSRPGQAFPAATVFIVTAPYSNPKPFAAWLSMSEPTRNDFETGLNLDQGVGSPPSLQIVNVEGAGNLGMRNLLKGQIPYGSVVRLCVTSKPGKEGTALWVNGQRHGARDRGDNSVIHLEEFVLGARRYTLGGPPEVRGFLNGDVAEVLVFDHALSNDDRKAIEKYLAKKYGEIPPLSIPGVAGQGKPLERVKASPPVQVLVPGFAVQELPLDLTNLNNVLYRPDGKLVALGYDGNVWLLSDTNADGLEDQATLFWENKGQIRGPIGMDLTPPNYARGNGVFVTSKGKCSLFVDTDGDDRADQEVIVAEGWKESPHGVDALGVAVDPRDGGIYFGIGTMDFTNAYLLNQTGAADFDIQSERGTILRIAPDLKSREIVATGIRFPVGLRFNKSGDLFCTDQEGATWLPNGNPFDELLHIQKGRHYGFPPRHPRHLPNVIDEPSTFDYGPQHQSTCGFCFNDPVKQDGPTFGPKSWAGDAFVTGYSRGKLYRTQLAKTSNGYVAQSSLFACLSMLPSDCCITPDGGLLVVCHSGGPDWGSGPTGKGKLFKIRYADQNHPQPVLAWAASPRELRVEFDRPVEPGMLSTALTQTDITAGQFVAAGDRFESFWPGYAAVQIQNRSPRKDIKVYSAQLTPDNRTLVLATDALRSAVHYSVTLPGMGRPTPDQTKPGDVPQQPQIDIAFTLAGVDAQWKQDGQVVWSGWLPSLDLARSRHWTTGSASHDKLWSAMQQKGELTLATGLNLVDMLRPAVQPGSRLDHEFPSEEVFISFVAPSQTRIQVRDAQSNASAEFDPAAGAIRFPSRRGELASVALRLPETTLEAALGLSASYSTQEDKRPRPFQPHRAFLPWAIIGDGDEQLAAMPLAKELIGGSWSRGWKIFHNAQYGCAKCHSLHGMGAKIGPDLSNLIHRDYASVMRDINQPSFAINPEFLASTVVATDGRVLTGVLRTVAGQLHIGDANGKTTIISPTEIEELKASTASVMPEGLLKPLNAEQTRDLLTYLLTSGPAMPRDVVGVPRPAPRSTAEVNALLAGAPAPPEQWRRLRVVLVAGPKDHGPGEHDYPAWLKAWNELLSIGDNLEVVTASGWPERTEFQTADVMVFYQRGEWNARRAADIDGFLERGGGLVYVHWAVDGQQDTPGFAKRIALAWGAGSRFRHGPLSLSFNHDPQHPATRGFKTLKLVDESYWNLTGQLSPDRVLGSGIEENQPQPLFWSLEQGRGRVFVSIPGHYSWTFDDPLFRILLLRGIAWTAKEPVDRFNNLVWPGADLTN